MGSSVVTIGIFIFKTTFFSLFGFGVDIKFGKRCFFKITQIHLKNFSSTLKTLFSSAPSVRSPCQSIYTASFLPWSAFLSACLHCTFRGFSSRAGRGPGAWEQVCVIRGWLGWGRGLRHPASCWRSQGPEAPGQAGVMDGPEQEPSEAPGTSASEPSGSARAPRARPQSLAHGNSLLMTCHTWNQVTLKCLGATRFSFRGSLTDFHEDVCVRCFFSPLGARAALW